MRISDWSSDVCSSDLEHRRHLFPNLVDRLERAHHHFEIIYFSFVVPADDIDSVDLDSIEAALELEHRLIAIDDLAQIAEIVAAEEVARGVEVRADIVELLERKRVG